MKRWEEGEQKTEIEISSRTLDLTNCAATQSNLQGADVAGSNLGTVA